MASEAAIEFTDDELVTVAELADQGLPIGLGDPEDLPAEVRHFLIERARKSLEDRGIVKDGVVHESVAELLSVAAEPGIICSCAVERDQIVDTTFLLAVPDLAVEHSSPATSLHRFTPFLPRDLMLRLIRLVDLRPAASADVDGFVAPVLAIEAATALARDDSLEEGAAALAEAGVDPMSATGFAASAQARHSTVLVTILHKPEPELVVGGQLTWIDCGFRGLWKVEAQGDDDRTTDTAGATEVRVDPVDASDLAAELLSFLPGPFGGLDTPVSGNDVGGPPQDSGPSDSSR